MRNAAVFLRLGLVVLVLTALPLSASAKDKDGGYQTAFLNLTGQLPSFSTTDVAFDGSALVLTRTVTQSGNDNQDPPFYNGGAYVVGEATSAELSTSFPFNEAIASWNADTPDGTWIEVQMRAQFGTRWTKWYNMGVWASTDNTIHRHSVRLQGDSDGYVSVDTLVLTAKKQSANGLQLKVRLFRTDGLTVTPSLKRLAVTYNTTAPKKFATTTGNTAIGPLQVPLCSQMIYPDGGNVWCSPTSTSMVLGYWGAGADNCKDRIYDAVAGVYDWVYDGHGNWPFNAAYAATKTVGTQDMEAYVVRYTGLDQVEPWVKAGIPVVASYAWGKGELTNAPIPSSSGHLGVIVGFTENGDVIMNDPAADSDAGVRRTYLRSEFESLWLANSGGTVYLIYPPGHAVPGF